MNYPKRIYVLPSAAPRGIPARVHVAPPPPPPSRPMKRPIETEEIVAELLGDDLGPSGPRKRERLTHLTQEEKMDRRKMKNRMAAQNARDKKKERSGKIDEVMRDLVEENRRLRVENEQLRRQNELLTSSQQSQQQVHYTPEDANIYQNVVYEEEVVEEEPSDDVISQIEEDHHAFESAEFINAPLPWDKAARSNSIQAVAVNNNNAPCRRTDSNKKINVDTYLTIISLLCNQMDRCTSSSKRTNISSESLSISRAPAETSTDSSLTTLKKEVRRLLLLQDPSTTRQHLQKRVKHFRRVP